MNSGESKVKRNQLVIKVVAIILPAIILAFLGLSKAVFINYGQEIILIYGNNEIVVDIDRLDKNLIKKAIDSYGVSAYAVLERENGVDEIKKIQLDRPRKSKYIYGNISMFLDENKQAIDYFGADGKKSATDIEEKAKYVHFYPDLRLAQSEKDKIDMVNYKKTFYKLGDSYINIKSERVD